MQIPTPRGMLSITLVFFLFFNSGRITASQYVGKKISIKSKEITLANVLKQIEKQTGYRFLYEINAFNGNERVNIDFDQANLSDVLKNVFENRGLMCQVSDGIISLKKYESKSPVSINNDFPPNNTITGKIFDESGSPIPGATIIIKGTSKGTKSNADGSFTLSGVEPGTTLIISSIGYQKKEVIVDEKMQLNINLIIATGTLNEKVIIAYGVSTKKNIIGNVSTITAKEIENSPVNNPLLAIQGRVPGILVNQATGLPGGGISTIIQGQNSLKNGTDPFFVIDGVPFISQMLPNLGGILKKSGGNMATTGNPLSLINPSDIESITVLKDADATSIYGSRAANGAILITTKRGKASAMRVDFNLQQGWQKISKDYKLLNTTQYLQMRREAILLDGLSVSPEDYDINGFWDTTRNTNWYKTLVGGTAHYTNLTSSVSGGNANIQYNISSTYHRETVIFPGNFSDQKGNIHINLSGVSPNQKFRIQISSNYLLDDNKLPNSDLTSSALSLAPTAPALYNKDGSLNYMPNSSGQSTFFNPLAYTLTEYDSKSTNFLGNAVLEYNIIPGLYLRSSFGYNSIKSDEVTTRPLVSYDPSSRPFSNRVGVYGNSQLSSWIIEPQINYQLNLGENHFDVLLGTTIQNKQSNGYQVVGIGYNSDAVIKDILATSRLVPLSSLSSVYKYNALFGRVSYNLLGRYLINVSGRRDGTSRFGSQSRFHNFGSIGAGWIFSEEPFWKEIFPIVSFGKLRASYGTTGNDQIPDYAYLSLYSPFSVGVPYRGITSLAPTRITNSLLQWEETRKTSLGIDVGLLNDKVMIGLTRNINKSYKQLVSQGLPYTAGISTVTINLPATVQNTGWELTIDSKNINKRKFNWSTGFNITVPKNKLLSYSNLEQSVDYGFLFIGESVSTITATHFKGVDPQTGLYQFLDAKGNTTSSPTYPGDRTVHINLDPQFYAGLQNTFIYKGFELDILFQYVKRKNYNNFFGNYPGLYNNNQPVEVFDRWRKPGDQVSHERFSSDFSLGVPFGAATLSDRAISDASYIRLKNLVFGWSLPENFIKKARIKNLKVNLQAQNLLTFTKYIGIDPESGPSSLPPLKTFVFSLQMGL